MSEEDEIATGRREDVVRWDKMVKSIKAVCQITVIDTSGTTKEKKASGCLVQLKLDGNSTVGILTNHHVIKNKEIAAKTLATFNYDGEDEPVIINVDPDILFKTSSPEDYDYTLVGVKTGDLNAIDIRPLLLQPISQHELPNITRVQIAQHPQGKPKRFSAGSVCAIQAKYILYDADTSAGSSGSPVFYVRNEQYFVLALHKSGGVVSSLCKHLVNKGVFVNHILDHLNGDPVKLMQPLEEKKRVSESRSRFTPPETIRIASRILDKWEVIALATGKFNDKETANIRLDHNCHDNVLKATRMLSAYQRRMGTREDFVSVLKEFEELDLAEKVQSKYFQKHRLTN